MCLVGFTKWSSERSPNEVFKLLELLFWEFDDVAARLKIFKLGTIGDCYIAVTGIPEPVQDHAVLLTQFAFEVRDKCREVCARLESEGLDTARLDMRFGIHSGDTTAGILRGTKSRFELFGDTINQEKVTKLVITSSALSMLNPKEHPTLLKIQLGGEAVKLWQGRQNSWSPPLVAAMKSGWSISRARARRASGLSMGGWVRLKRRKG